MPKALYYLQTQGRYLESLSATLPKIHSKQIGATANRWQTD